MIIAGFVVWYLLDFALRIVCLDVQNGGGE